MKRKRGRGGYRKGKKANSAKGLSTELASPNIEDNGEDQPDDDQASSENDLEPSSTGPDKTNTVSNIDDDLPINKTYKVGHGRVKVKLKSSKISEHHRSTSDVQTVSETDRSNPQAILENEISTGKDETTCSDGQTSELHSSASEKLPRKAGSIKIKSSSGLSFSNQTIKDRNVGKLDDSVAVHSGRKLVIADIARTANSTVPQHFRRREKKLLDSGSLYNEKELSSALVVIKKIMKMDAAAPFNSPVDPVALGIPDYFDVIKTPMDFGTICTNLERQQKYTNSEDVYKDVQYIWDNCYTYNNKGDYIVDLMKRVKKNFLKYWLAAGLYSDVLDEGIQMDDTSRPGTEKLHAKSKSKHKRRGIDKHKSDCLCAVCAVRRRRKEREENPTPADIRGDAVRDDFSRYPKLEENTPLDISGSEDVTSSLDHSPVVGAKVDMEEAGNEEKSDSPELDMMDVEKEGLFDANGANSISSHGLPLENEAEVTNKHYGVQDTDGVQTVSRVNDAVLWQKKGAMENQQGKGADWESYERRTRVTKVQEDPVLEENHLFFKISRSLFPSDSVSVWNGPHSFSKRTNSAQESPIHAAVASLMKR